MEKRKAGLSGNAWFHDIFQLREGRREGVGYSITYVPLAAAQIRDDVNGKQGIARRRKRTGHSPPPLSKSVSSSFLLSPPPVFPSTFLARTLSP